MGTLVLDLRNKGRVIFHLYCGGATYAAKTDIVDVERENS